MSLSVSTSTVSPTLLERVPFLSPTLPKHSPFTSETSECLSQPLPPGLCKFSSPAQPSNTADLSYTQSATSSSLSPSLVSSVLSDLKELSAGVSFRFPLFFRDLQLTESLSTQTPHGTSSVLSSFGSSCPRPRLSHSKNSTKSSLFPPRR